MAIFLNTEKLNYWIPKLIRESKKEVVLIVPYIKTSNNILSALKDADKKNIHVVLIYKEEKLSAKEMDKLLAFENLNMLCHPNVHCKCYFNGELMIIGSMNLYEYSEKNNREMGILLSRELPEEIEKADKYEFYEDDSFKVFEDGVDEIREIVRGSKMIRQSKITLEKHDFDIDIIKTTEELTREECSRLNKYFLNKKFEPYLYKEEWLIKCSNFYDKIDVMFDDRRMRIKINMVDEELKELFNRWKETYHEYQFNGFKHYWNYYNQDIFLYPDRKYNFWDKEWNKEKDMNLLIKAFEKGINSIIENYKMLKKN